MNINLDKHTQKIINDFMAIDPVLANVLKLASEVSYLKGYQDSQDSFNRFLTAQEVRDNTDINMAYEGVN